MNDFASYEVDTILEGLEQLARAAKTPDEKAMADVVYRKIVDLTLLNF